MVSPVAVDPTFDVAAERKRGTWLLLIVSVALFASVVWGGEVLGSMDGVIVGLLPLAIVFCYWAADAAARKRAFLQLALFSAVLVVYVEFVAPEKADRTIFGTLVGVAVVCCLQLRLWLRTRAAS